MRIQIQPELQCWSRDDLNANPDPDVSSKPRPHITIRNVSISHLPAMKQIETATAGLYGGKNTSSLVNFVKLYRTTCIWIRILIPIQETTWMRIRIRNSD
jgi:hypothetical protein